MKESAPEFRDAVVEGFAVNSDDLERVATPELLDSIAVNLLALRLKNRDFAREIYEDIRDQAIRAPERWYDVDVSIHLSSIDDEDASAVPRYAVTAQWEYTVTPSLFTQRFACVSDRDEFQELVSDVPATSTWLMTRRMTHTGRLGKWLADAQKLGTATLDPTVRTAFFEAVGFAVDADSFGGDPVAVLDRIASRGL